MKTVAFRSHETIPAARSGWSRVPTTKGTQPSRAYVPSSCQLHMFKMGNVGSEKCRLSDFLRHRRAGHRMPALGRMVADPEFPANFRPCPPMLTRNRMDDQPHVDHGLLPPVSHHRHPREREVHAAHFIRCRHGRPDVALHWPVEIIAIGDDVRPVGSHSTRPASACRHGRQREGRIIQPVRHLFRYVAPEIDALDALHAAAFARKSDSSGRRRSASPQARRLV